MKPRIRFELKDSVVYVNITIADLEPQSFSMGITIDPGQWEQRKQICGDPDKQKFLQDAKKNMELIYLPGIDAQTLWSKYNESVNSGRTHTVDQAFKYIIANKKMAAQTRRGYEDMQKKANAYGFGGVVTTSLTAARIKQFLDTIREREALKEGSIYLYYSKLESAVNYYMSDHGLETRGSIEGIMRAPHIDRGKIQYSEERYLDTEQFCEFLSLKLQPETSIYEAFTLFVIQCATGMAMAEVFLIKNLDDYIVEIDSERWFKYKRKKTGRWCMIPMTDLLRRALDAFQPPIKFTTRTYNNYLILLGKMIGQDLSSHVGRHTFGAIMLESGFTIETVSKMMGHSSIAITEQCYSKITKNRVRKERDIALPALNEIAKSILTI